MYIIIKHRLMSIWQVISYHVSSPCLINLSITDLISSVDFPRTPHYSYCSTSRTIKMHCIVGRCVCCGRTVPRGWIAATRPHGFSRNLSTMMHQPDWQLDTSAYSPIIVAENVSGWDRSRPSIAYCLLVVCYCGHAPIQARVQYLSWRCSAILHWLVLSLYFKRAW
jgi:hypothetical protein